MSWKVLEDKRKFNKRYVKVKDEINNVVYSNYFPLSASNTVVLAKMKSQVIRYRAEMKVKQSTLDLKNFEPTGS